MMAPAIASRGGSSTPQLCKAWMANSNAMPKRRVVSGSNLSPSKYCLIGIVEKQIRRIRPGINMARKGTFVGVVPDPRNQLLVIILQGATEMTGAQFEIRIDGTPRS